VGESGRKWWTLFRGVATAKLDAKARITIAGKYRPGFAENSVFLTVDPSRCLLLYPKQHWLDIEAKLLALPSLESRARSLQRLLLGHAEEVEIDAQNRILISEPLRNFAGLEHDVVLVGQGKKIELWQTQRWQAEIETGILATQMSGASLPTFLGDLNL
jgi:MraZ protein